MARKVDRSYLEGESIVLFRAAIRSTESLDGYERKLLQFLNSIRMRPDEYVTLAKEEPSRAERLIMQFIIEERKRIDAKQITAGTLSNTVKSVRLLLEMNDVIFNWRKIRRLIPSVRKYAINDRIPTRDELRAIVNGSDLRGKAMTLVFISSGIREGAIKYLKIADLSPVEEDGKIVAGRILVYGGEAEQYFTFITPEAYSAVKDYLKFREDNGETLHKASPMFRDVFDTKSNLYKSYVRPDPNQPKTLDGHAIRVSYHRLFVVLGFRNGPKKRHEFTVHSFRKWFKTTAEISGMKPIDVETLLNHSTGISDSYYKATEKDLLTVYVRIVPQLTISEAEEVKREMHEQKILHEERYSALEQKVNLLFSAMQSQQATLAAPPGASGRPSGK